MSAPERAELLCNLYALRSRAAVDFDTANRERLLCVAANIAMARDAVSEAISALERHTAELKSEAERQTKLFP